MDWRQLVGGALCVVGLAVVLAGISYDYGLATARWRECPRRPSLLPWIGWGVCLVSAGCAVMPGGAWWARVVAIALALAAGWRATRDSRHQG